MTTYEAKDYIFERCIQHIKEFDYPKRAIDLVIVDNSRTPNYFYKLKRRGHKNLFRVERGENSREALTKAQNKIREIALKGGYDFLLFVESDLLPDKDLVWRLLNHGKPVVGSTYFIGTAEIKVPCIFLDDFQTSGFKATRPLGLVPQPNGQRFHDPEEVQRFLGRGLQRVHGCGFGCTLIHRSILERFPFWYDIRFDNKHSDVYFYLDLDNAKIPVYVDTDFIIPHYPSKWDDVADR